MGQGSLYRHFADRVELATAVFEQNLSEVKRAVQDSATPYSTFFDAIERQAVEASVMIEIVSSGESREASGGLRGDLRELVQGVLRASQEAGELAAEVSVEDLLTAVSMLALTVAKAPAERRAGAARRARGILDSWFLQGDPGAEGKQDTVH